MVSYCLGFGKIGIHKLYINGVLIDTGANIDFSLTATETLCFLGKNRTTANYLDGYMSDCRFYKRELTNSEILMYYINNPLFTLPDYQIKLHLTEV
jgi:hypothetical protein